MRRLNESQVQGLLLGSEAGNHQWCCPPLKILGLGLWVMATLPFLTGLS